MRKGDSHHLFERVLLRFSSVFNSFKKNAFRRPEIRISHVFFVYNKTLRIQRKNARNSDYLVSG